MHEKNEPKKENPFKFPFVVLQANKAPTSYSGVLSNFPSGIIGNFPTYEEADKQARTYAAAQPAQIYTVVEIDNVYKREEPPVTRIDF